MSKCHASVGAPAFNEWFQNSKVTDIGGSPLIVYHGTDIVFKDFASEFIKNRCINEYGRGFYFTMRSGTASLYGDNVIAAYLSLKNPKFITPADFGDNGWHGAHDGVIVSLADAADIYDPSNWLEIVVAKSEQIHIIAA